MDLTVNLVNATNLLGNSSWVEKKTIGDLHVWHLMFIVTSVIVSAIVLVCCCLKIRIPRTKQEIEADYQRNRLTRNFRRQLNCINDDEMQDAIDLATVLVKVQENLDDAPTKLLPEEV